MLYYGREERVAWGCRRLVGVSLDQHVGLDVRDVWHENGSSGGEKGNFQTRMTRHKCVIFVGCASRGLVPLERWEVLDVPPWTASRWQIRTATTL